MSIKTTFEYKETGPAPIPFESIKPSGRNGTEPVSDYSIPDVGNPHKIIVAPSKKFKNEKCKNVKANAHMTNYLRNELKQDAIVLADELIEIARYDGKEKAIHKHGWLDNDGKHDWDSWYTYIQEKINPCGRQR